MTPYDFPPPDDPAAGPPAALPPTPPPGVPLVPAVADPLPGDVVGAAVLAGLRARFADQRRLADLALAQSSDAAFVAPLGPLDPLGVQVKHLGGSLRSRFTDFLTADGEKDDRDRDAEFVLGADDTRDALTARWDEAWETVDATLASLTPVDLGRTVTVRGEPMTVLDALLRALAHAAQHTGQIIALAKHHAGDAWRTLSVPRGGSAAYTAETRARFSR